MPPRRASSRGASPDPRGASPASSPRVRSPAPSKRPSPGFLARHANVYIYVPNLIGYARVAAVAGAFGNAFSRPELTLGLYLFAFVCDELDGRFARKFNQCSTFGAVLDMVTDRLSTTGLCLILAVLYRAHTLHFLALVCLDIGAHWAQMYASLLSKAASHKDVTTCSSPLLRLYYGKRLFMGSLCVGAEVFYLCLYLLASGPRFARMAQTGLTAPGVGKLGGVQALALFAAPFWALKQVTNLLQGQFAAQRLVAADAK